MKRIFGIFAVLAVMGIVFVACHHEEIGIDRLVTDAVIDQAISGLADDMSADYSLTKIKGITYMACMKARHAVFQYKMGKDWFNELYASITAAPNFDQDNYWVKYGGSRTMFEWYKGIMNTARVSLDSPEELKAAYLRHKDAALKCVSNNGIQKEVRDQIFRILPYFNGMAADSTIAFLKTSHDVSYQRGALLFPHWLGIEDLRAYEFAERRRAEGGDALVSAYAEIMTDFVATLFPGTVVFSNSTNTDWSVQVFEGHRTQKDLPSP